MVIKGAAGILVICAILWVFWVTKVIINKIKEE